MFHYLHLFYALQLTVSTTVITQAIVPFPPPHFVKEQ